MEDGGKTLPHFFEVAPHQCDIYSAGLTFLEMTGVDNIKSFINIEKKDKQLTIDCLTKNAIPYATKMGCQNFGVGMTLKKSVNCSIII